MSSETRKKWVGVFKSNNIFDIQMNVIDDDGMTKGHQRMVISQAENFLNEIEYRMEIRDEIRNEYNNISMLLHGLRRKYDMGEKCYLLRADDREGKIQVSREKVFELIERCIALLRVLDKFLRHPSS
jgi:hypothetical protein